MNRKGLLLLLLISYNSFAQLPATQFERSNGKETPTYPDIIGWWKKADAASGRIKMQPMGATDAGYPLHLVTIAGDPAFDFKKRGDKLVILINNGIHPGEPDGIDASMLLAKDIISGKIQLSHEVVLAIIPVYNIGGCLNRSENYRVDQNGPDAFGFRGNAQNLDLNRDFIKADSKNALSFAKIFHLTDPAILIDNHVSNGADYQHVMTLLSSQHSKLGGAMGAYLNNTMEPALYALMKAKGYQLVPYVNFDHNDKVEKGWPGFWDAPRYSSGYAALWNTFSFMPETHMLKSYEQRVWSTHALMKSFIEFGNARYKEIIKIRKQAQEDAKIKTAFASGWLPDPVQSSAITFMGYESGYKNSEVSGLPRLYYDRSKPYTKQVPFYNNYKVASTVKKPRAYLIPQGWWKVVERLKANEVYMYPLQSDTLIDVEAYRITGYKSGVKPYEGHHINTDVSISASTKQLSFRKGDWVIPMQQVANRFIVEVLEPVCEDSYFKWNFFDAVLQQKEGYSDYAFEDIAAAYLKENPLLLQRLDAKRKQDTGFAKSARAQLDFVYQNAPWIEPAYLQYPIYRLH